MQQEKQQKYVIPFHDDEIIAFSNNGDKFVAIKPVCEILKIDWSAQLKKLKSDSLMNSTMAVIATVGADDKEREMICLPLEMFPMWLVKINPVNFKEDKIREKIILFQREAAKVLFRYFFKLNQPPQTVEVEYTEYISLLKDKILIEKSKSIQPPKRTRRKMTDPERETIFKLFSEGVKEREIAKRIGRHPSSVYYELKGKRVKK